MRLLLIISLTLNVVLLGLLVRRSSDRSVATESPTAIRSNSPAQQPVEPVEEPGAEPRPRVAPTRKTVASAVKSTATPDLDVDQLLKEGKTDIALDKVKAALAKDPYNSELLATAAAIRSVYLNDKVGATELLEQSIEHDPNNAEALQHLTTLYLERGKIEDGRKFLEKAMATGDNKSLETALADLLVTGGKGREAIPHLRNLLSKDPNSMDANVMMGIALEQTGDADGALELYKRAETQREDEATRLNRSGQSWEVAKAEQLELKARRAALLMRIGNLAAAHDLALEVLKENPNNDLANRVVNSSISASQPSR